MTRIIAKLSFIALVGLSTHLSAVTDQEIEAALNQHMGNYAGMVTQEYRQDHFDAIKGLVAGGKSLDEIAKGTLDAVKKNLMPSQFYKLQQNNLSTANFQAIRGAAYKKENASVNNVIAHMSQPGATVQSVTNTMALLNKPQIIKPGTPEYDKLTGQNTVQAGAATLFEAAGQKSDLKGEDVEGALIKKFGFNPYAQDKETNIARIKEVVKDNKGLENFLQDLGEAYKSYITPDEFLGLQEKKISLKDFIAARKKDPKNEGIAVITEMSLKKDSKKS